MPFHVHVLEGSTGHDGQFYLRLAIDPLPDEATADGITLPAPAYVQQRIMYPLLARVAAGSVFRLVPIGLIAVNAAAFAVVAGAGAFLARAFGRSTWWGLAFVAWPGFLVTLGRDLTELVATAFVLTALVAAIRGQLLVAGLLLAAGVLTRETTLLVAAGYALVWLVRRDGTWRVFVPPLTAFAVWESYVGMRWRALPLWSGTASRLVHVPFSGMVGGLSRLRHDGSDSLLPFLMAAVVVVIAVAAAQTLRDRRVPAPWRAAYVFATVLVALSPPLVWRHDVNFLRAATELWVLGLASLLAAGVPTLRQIPMPLATISVAYAVARVSVP